MHSNTSRILSLFRHELKKLIAHLIPMVNLKLLVERFCDCCRSMKFLMQFLHLSNFDLCFLERLLRWLSVAVVTALGLAAYDSDGLLPGLKRRDINSLFGRTASLSRRLYGREAAYALVKKKGKAKDKYYDKLILDLGNEVRSSVEEGTTAMESLVKKLGDTEETAECKKLKNELEEAWFSNILLHMQNERVERDLY
ncbi:hypothetical protein Tco_0714406 [Tanacetum coccineum]